jgi:hypothetical protein
MPDWTDIKGLLPLLEQRGRELADLRARLAAIEARLTALETPGPPVTPPKPPAK